MQKFKRNDLVKIDKDLGLSMSHFPSGCKAIVIGSYADQYGGNNTNSYTVHIKGSGKHSWYWKHQLTLIKRNQGQLLESWKKEERREAEQKSNIDWIFNHGKEVLQNSHGATIGVLAAHLGITNLWGSHGEGFVYVENAMIVLLLAKPYLKTGDKEGWLKKAENIKRNFIEKEQKKLDF